MKRLGKNMLLLSACAALAVAAHAGPSKAASVAAPATSGDATAAGSYVGDAVGGAEDYWAATASAVRAWIPGFSTGSLLKRQLSARQDKSEADFKHMMSVAGYAVKSINLGVGLVPKFSFYFGQKREMSEADQVYIERLLRKHERTQSGPVALAQRMIINTVVQLQAFPDYNLTKVSVTMLPVPYVEFIAEPKEATLDPDMSYLAQRIRDLNMKLEALTN